MLGAHKRPEEGTRPLEQDLWMFMSYQVHAGNQIQGLSSAAEPSLKPLSNNYKAIIDINISRCFFYTSNFTILCQIT